MNYLTLYEEVKSNSSLMSIKSLYFKFSRILNAGLALFSVDFLIFFTPNSRIANKRMLSTVPPLGAFTMLSIIAMRVAMTNQQVASYETNCHLF